MTKFVIMSIILTAPLLASASFQCDITVKKAYRLDALNSVGALNNSIKEQLNAAPTLSDCSARALTLLDEQCKKNVNAETAVADALVVYTYNKAIQYQTKAIIRGNCEPRSLMSALGYKKLGFEERERYGFIERK